MTKLLFTIAFVFLLTSCISDFDQDPNLNTNLEKIPVLNSFLNPDSLIRIDLYWSKSVYDTLAYTRITNAHIILLENETVICDTIWEKDSSLVVNHLPLEGFTYTITVEIPGKKPIIAQTTIPEKTSAELSVELKPGFFLNLNHCLYFTDENTGEFSTWIVVLAYDTNNVVVQSQSIYSNILFADNINKYADSDNFYDIKYNYVFEGFIRFPKGIFKKGDRLYYIPVIDLNKEAIDHISTCIITASPEYDLYSRSAYLQISYDVEVKTPLLYQPVHVFSNIKNGQGVFAGYNNNELVGFEASNLK